MRLALIDADVVVYKAAWACEKPLDWGDGIHTLHVSEATLGQAIDSIVIGIEKLVEPDRTLFCLSDPKRNFRKGVYPQYKDNRAQTRKPIAWAAARRYVESSFKCISREALEADDIMGIMATGAILGYEDCDEKIICSIDKDMLQIPSLHFRWNEPERGIFRVSDEEADRAFYVQCLAGDPTDGYPGIPSVGPRSAMKILDGERVGELGVWPTIVAAYARKGLDEEYALSMARCARILRASDFNFETKEVNLWTPPIAPPAAAAPEGASSSTPTDGTSPCTATPAKRGRSTRPRKSKDSKPTEP